MQKDSSINSENDSIGLSDLEEFDKPGKVKYLIIGLVLLAIAAAAYFLFYQSAKDNLPVISMATTILEDGKISNKKSFRLKDPIYIYIDYKKPLKQNKVEIQFFKLEEEKKPKYKGKQEHQIFNSARRRVSFYLAAREFERWGFGDYKLVVISSSGEALLEKKFNLK